MVAIHPQPEEREDYAPGGVLCMMRHFSSVSPPYLFSTSSGKSELAEVWNSADIEIRRAWSLSQSQLASQGNGKDCRT